MGRHVLIFRYNETGKIEANMRQEPNMLIVNGESRAWRPGLTVGRLLASLGLDPAAVVVERNGAVLSRESSGETPLADGDILEIIHFVGGG